MMGPTRRATSLTSRSLCSLNKAIAALTVLTLLTLAYSANHLKVNRDGLLTYLVFGKRSIAARAGPSAVESLVVAPRIETTTKESPLAKNNSADKLGVSPTSMKFPDRKKTILLWTGFSGSHSRWNRFFDDMINGRCPESNCEITTNRSFLNSSDALFFHTGEVSKRMILPSHRPSGQVWILWTIESAVHVSNNYKRLQVLNGQINLTMSYNRQSDILFPYGLVVKRKETQTGWTARLLPHEVNLEPSELVGTKKTRLVAWMASNCAPNSRRQDFIKEFQKHIQIDTYGRCGKMKCGVSEFYRLHLKNRTNCDDVMATYKFYMAFENSLCPDYITEKFYRTLTLGVVPIVLAEMGHATLAPPDSYIDASKFTPKSLAKYLNYLDKNNTAYNEYFQWRTDYVVLNAYPFRYFSCGLCDTLHNLDKRKSAKSFNSVYHGLGAPWLTSDQCYYWDKYTLSLAPTRN